MSGSRHWSPAAPQSCASHLRSSVRWPASGTEPANPGAHFHRYGKRRSGVRSARLPDENIKDFLSARDLRIYRRCSTAEALRLRASAVARLDFPAALRSSTLRSWSSVHVVSCLRLHLLPSVNNRLLEFAVSISMKCRLAATSLVPQAIPMIQSVNTPSRARRSLAGGRPGWEWTPYLCACLRPEGR
jgi:hypothetical protein